MIDLRRSIFLITVIISIFSTVLLPSSKSAGNLNLPEVFSNNMILQRNVTVPVWGTARSEERITVEFDNQTKSTIADNNGNWSVKLNPMKAGGPFKMKVFDAEGESINLKNILVGEVWICAGQSNMNLDLKEIGLDKKDFNKINNKNLREFRCAMPEGAINPENIDHSKWIPAGDTATKRFSAVAYYFAQKIQEVEKVPVGIIVMSCGATRAETWISMKTLKKYTALKPMLNYWSGKMHDNKYLINFKPSIFYKSVVEPVIPFAIKGIVWYQGESNTLPDNSGRTILSRADEYETLLKALITSWRKVWNDENLPFNIVQLPNYSDPSGNIYWSVIRQAQLDISQKMKNVGLTVTIDLGGNGATLHPHKKEPVGDRIALWALAKVYGKKGIVFSGPIIRSMNVSDGKVYLTFKHIGKGLVCRNDDTLNGFEISGNSSRDKFIKANAVIKDSQVVLSAPGLKNPYAVRYAWADNPAVSLFNAEGLPACPFYISRQK